METKIAINLVIVLHVIVLHHVMNAVILEVAVIIRYDYNYDC